MIPPRIVLASSSPRRKELFGLLGRPFEILHPDVEEIPAPGEAPRAFAGRAARDKAQWAADRLPAAAGSRAWVIGADTIVVLDNLILGKPADDADAARMLRMLSGRRHEVMTGVCILDLRPGGPPRAREWVTVTAVEFAPLRAEDIEAYVRTGEPRDKAGAYAVQGQAAGMIRAISGSYTNVVGLPLCELAETLSDLACQGSTSL